MKQTTNGCTANAKHGIDGRQLVLAEDGTEIDDDQVLRCYAEKGVTMIILGEGQQWTPAKGKAYGIDYLVCLIEARNTCTCNDSTTLKQSRKRIWCTLKL